MSQPTLTQLEVLDIVPFGNTGGQAAFFALRLTPPGWTSWHPGQFVMLRKTGAGSEILWARPFSICTVTPRDLVIFFQVRGRATTAMSELNPGDMLDVWGPLGNAFAVEARTPTLLLAGGIGIAPFVGYVHNHPTPWDIHMEFGHRMPLECYPFDSINEKTIADAHQERDEADREEFLQKVGKRIADIAAVNGLVLACGPTPFLRVVQDCALQHKARTQLCLETRMACGVGACLGCVVKADISANNDEKGGIRQMGGALPEGEGHYVQTCSCGPNFWADSVHLD